MRVAVSDPIIINAIVVLIAAIFIYAAVYMLVRNRRRTAAEVQMGFAPVPAGHRQFDEQLAAFHWLVKQQSAPGMPFAAIAAAGPMLSWSWHEGAPGNPGNQGDALTANQACLLTLGRLLSGSA